jgi:hypothetical protein
VPRTFADLIRSVSRNVGDLYTGTLTDMPTVNTPADSKRTEGDGWWTGANLTLAPGVDGLLPAEEQRVTAWTSADHTFATNAYLARFAIGTAYELRRRPKHTRQAVKEFLNAAVRETERQSWVAVDSYVDLGLTTLLYKLGLATYAVPAGMEFVNTVLYQDILDPWGNLPWYELDQDKWSANLVDGSVLIQQLDNYNDWDRSSITIPDGAPLRFVGSKRPTEFVLESDVTPFEGNYLEVFATARLCLSLAEGAQDEADFNAKFQMFYKLESDAFRGTRRGLPGGSRKIR